MVHDLVEGYVNNQKSAKSKSNAAIELKKTVSHIL